MQQLWLKLPRSTTSGLYISIDEKEIIIDDLVYEELEHDLSSMSQAHSLLKQYMGEFHFIELFFPEIF